MDACCTVCSTQKLDFLHKSGPLPPCPVCGGALEQIKTTAGQGKAGPVRPDEIPGGLEIKHGLCNEDGTPRKYYSHSEIAAEARRRGYINYVTHETDNVQGTDKNKFTVRWVGTPQGLTPELEAERVRAWHEDEERLQRELAEKGQQCVTSTVITTVTD